MMPTVVPTGFLRAPESNALAYVFQAFMDEVAAAAGTDLPTMMLATLGERRVIAPPAGGGMMAGPVDTGRARDVIEKVVAVSDWKTKPTQKGRAKGFAFYFSHQGYFAEVVEASVTKAGEVAVHKVWVAADVGSQIINPMHAENQVRGSIIDGLAQAIAGQAIEVVDGAVQQSNFHDFPLARIPITPQIEIHWGQIGQVADGPGRAGATAGDPRFGQRAACCDRQAYPFAAGETDGRIISSPRKDLGEETPASPLLEPRQHGAGPAHDFLRPDQPCAVDPGDDVAHVPAPVEVRMRRRAVDRGPGVGSHHPVIGPAFRIGLEDELRHLVLVTGEIGAVVEFAYQPANLVAALPHFDLAAARLFGGDRISANSAR
jgi:hypothetical protein